MTTSAIELQRGILLHTLRVTASDEEDKWKILVCDKDSRALLNNVATEDDVLSANVIVIEQLEDPRETQPETKAIYLLSPLPHILEWLKADLSRKRYRLSWVIWTSQLRPELAASIESNPRVKKTWSLNIDFFPQESHVITFRDLSSFQILFNRSCDTLIRRHLDELTRRIVSVCVSLGEYPLVRYYRPRNARHDAAVLCTHIAKFVQDGLDDYARSTPDFPPPSHRPRAVLLITDRSMDLMAPVVHELTYQAMAMDLLPIQESGNKLLYRNIIRRGQPDQEEKEVQITDKDKIWIENRHLHMKDLLVKLSDDFRKFQAQNPQFAENDGQNLSVNVIKDMLAGLGEFQEGKEAFSLHIDMAEKCAKLFQDQKLLDVTSLEQSLATGLDEDGERPKNITDQLVRLLADESVVPDNRARLLMMYAIYRGGILHGDVTKLRKHGELPEVHNHIIYNMENLGARIGRALSDPVIPYDPLYPSRKITYAQGEEVSLSRFEPMLRYALEEICQGNLDNTKFPPTKPHLDNQNPQANAAQTSLRSAGKPTWANTRPSANKPRQRIIVFIAGGATYSEARTCYEVSHQMGREVFLTTSQMWTPKTFFREASLLDQPRKQLQLPIDEPIPQPPRWMQQPSPEQTRPQQPPAQQASQNSRIPAGILPPTNDMQRMNLGPPKPQNGSSRPSSSQTASSSTMAGSFSSQPGDSSGGKLKKDKKEKKHLGIFRKH